MPTLADWFRQHTEDYGQLKDAYPNAKKFGSALKSNVSKLVPTEADFQSPQKMGEWGLSAALNAPMGLMFTGPKSAGWNASKAAEAEKMLNAGVDPAQVWKEHLIGRMPDNSLFSEISDKEANMLPLEKGGVSYKADKAINHNDLLNNYPDLSSLYFSKGNSTYYSPEMNHIKIEKVNTTSGDNPLADIAQSRLTGLAERLDKKNMLNDKRSNKLDTLYEAMYSKYPDIAPTSSFDKSSSLHELQHAIQEQEGWGKGGSPEMFNQQSEAQKARDALMWAQELKAIKKKSPYLDLMSLENKAVKNYEEMGLFDMLPSREARDLGSQPRIVFNEKYPESTDFKDLSDLVSTYGLKHRVTPYSPMEAYKRLTGEAQARATQDRMGMNMQQRRDTYPLAGDKLSDIPLSQLINRYR